MRLQTLQDIPLGITDANALKRSGRREAASQRLRRHAMPGRITVAGAGKGIFLAMTTSIRTGDHCSVCMEPVKGGFSVFSYSRLGDPQLGLESTPDRNFNVCDFCGVTICFRCSMRPDSGYCNECYRMLMASQGMEDEERAHTNEPSTEMQEPTIIYEEPKGSELKRDDRLGLVWTLIKRREFDLTDFQARIDGLTQKILEIADDFQTQMSELDAAILQVMEAETFEQAQEAARKFDHKN